MRVIIEGDESYEQREAMARGIYAFLVSMGIGTEIQEEYVGRIGKGHRIYFCEFPFNSLDTASKMRQYFSANPGSYAKTPKERETDNATSDYTVDSAESHT